MKKDKKNFVWNVIGLSLNAFVSLFLLIVVKRINGIDTAGIFTYAFSLSCLFYISCCFFSRTFQVSEYKREFSFGDYFSSRIIFDVINLVIAFIFCIISGFDKYKIIIIILLTFYKCIEALCDSIFAQMQIEGNLYRSGISYSLKAILGIIIFFLIDYYTKSLLLSVIGLCVSILVVLFVYDFSSLENKIGRLTFNKDKFKKLLIVTFPIFIYSFLQNYLSNSQKIIMTYFIENKLQTIFGILIMPATMLILVGNYIIMPFVNDLTDRYKNKQYKEFDKVVNKMCLAVIIIGLVCILLAYLFGIPVLNFIYNINLEEYKMMLIVILVGSIFTSMVMVFSNALTILTINKKQTIMYLIISLIATVITIILANFYGIKGLCYSYLVTFLLLVSSFYIVYKYQIKKLEG